LLLRKTTTLACTVIAYEQVDEKESGKRYLTRHDAEHDITIYYSQINVPTMVDVHDTIIRDYNFKKCYSDIYISKSDSYLSVNFIKLYCVLSIEQEFRNLAKEDYHIINALVVYNVGEREQTEIDGDIATNLTEMPLYQAVDENAVFYKYIDYSMNSNAKTFKDMFQFEQFTHKAIPNLKANSCFINMIIATYKTAIEKVDNKGYRLYKDDLTYEYLCDLFKIEYKDQDIGLTIKQSTAFFEKYHLSLVVLDGYKNIIFKYPENEAKETSRISPHTLYILVHNNHCFKLNADKSFIETIHNKDTDMAETIEELKASLSNRFYFRNTEEEATEKRYDIDKLDDVVKYVASMVAENNKKN